MAYLVAVSRQGNRHATLVGSLETLCGRPTADMTLIEDDPTVDHPECLLVLARNRMFNN